MTVQEALEALKIEQIQIEGKAVRVVKFFEGISVANEALEKQIPKKPINKTKCDNSTANRYENCNIIVCPLCNGRLKLKSKGKYCDKCGQALDWGDSE